MVGKDRHGDDEDVGQPVYTYEAVPGVPPVSVLKFRGWEFPPGELPPGHAHSHDFLVLCYFGRGGGSLRLGDREWAVEAGDAYIIAPGEVVGVGGDAGGFRGAEGWSVFFPPEVLGSQAPGAVLSWRSHPLLFPFLRGAGKLGAQRLKVPPGDRPFWSWRFSALNLELRERRDGYQEAVLSHLTLLLVELSRLTWRGSQAQGRAPARRGLRLYRRALR